MTTEQIKRMAIRSVSFSTTPYEREHGKQPRGYGAWAFQRLYGGTLVGEIKFFTGTVAEAKKMAAEAFADLTAGGLTDVAILE